MSHHRTVNLSKLHSKFNYIKLVHLAVIRKDDKLRTHPTLAKLPHRQRKITPLHFCFLIFHMQLIP